MAFTRRSLIGRGALLVASGFLAPSFLTRTAIAVDGPAALDASKKNMILVVLQLSGGNDGLNTLIRFAHPDYARLRPSLESATGEVLHLTDSVGLNPNLGKLKALYDQ